MGVQGGDAIGNACDRRRGYGDHRQGGQAVIDRMRVYRVEVRVRGEQGWVKSDVLFYILGDASEYAWRLYRQPQVETWQVVDEGGEVLLTHGRPS